MVEFDRAKFEKEGYLVIPGAFQRNELEAIRERMLNLIREHDLSEFHSFDTIDQKQAKDQYFLRSGSNISFFLEDHALGSDGKLKVDKTKAFNKVGHALHDIDPVFEKFSYHPTLLDACLSLGQKSPQIVQSMFIFKSPRIGGEVTPHQDSSFIQTSPHSCLGTWVGLEDATQTNGCMWVVPGSHKIGVKKLFSVAPDGSHCSFDHPEVKYDIASAVPVEVTAGSLVILHGSLVHFSGHNDSTQSRNAFTLHIVDAATAWSESNWIKRPAELPFRLFEDVSKQLYE